MFLSEEQQKAVELAITNAEKCTSGEIRVHIESSCKIDVLDRAAYVFKTLEMHKTEQRNGVLFYLATEDKKFAILGDVGINQKVPENFWEEIKTTMLTHFVTQDFSAGLVQGITVAGQQLQAFFPYQKNDTNELSNQISFGK